MGGNAQASLLQRARLSGHLRKRRMSHFGAHLRRLRAITKIVKDNR